MQRVIAYVDGFNLYFGMKSRGWRRYYWLDTCDLARNLLRPYQRLDQTKYFTARIAGPAGKLRRQTAYIDALSTLPDLSIFYGKYQSLQRTCRQCGFVEDIQSEKMTDVNIATELMADAYQDSFDTALLVSADSDLTGPVNAVRRLFPGKRVVAAFPPDRHSDELSRAATATIYIGRGTIAKSQLPLQIVTSAGVVLNRPDRWV